MLSRTGGTRKDFRGRSMFSKTEIYTILGPPLREKDIQICECKLGTKVHFVLG